MNLHHHPELLDRLAASYALGTLRGGARRRFEALARERAPVRAAALIWQSRFASINELQTSAQPSPAVWTRIESLVRAEREQAAMQAARQPTRPAESPSSWLRNLNVWRAASALGALATWAAIAVGVNLRHEMGNEVAKLQSQLQTAPQIEYVAVLADDKAVASMLVTFDPKNKKLTLQRVGGYREASDRSLQLWALPPSGAPRSLGVLGDDKLLHLTAAENQVRQAPTLAISLEPKGGVPSETGPTGPVLFKGALIQNMM